jgi:hypothetical protein
MTLRPSEAAGEPFTWALSQKSISLGGCDGTRGPPHPTSSATPRQLRAESPTRPNGTGNAHPTAPSSVSPLPSGYVDSSYGRTTKSDMKFNLA